MAEYLRHKLERYVRLSGEDREGEKPNFVNLVIDGWGFRHKMLEDGRRQIIAFLLPGDICDLNVVLLNEMDHSIGALTEVTVAQIAPETLEQVQKNRPRLAAAVGWDMLVQAAIQREWTVNLGQRSAIERISHLICELYARLDVVELCDNGHCHIPLTQTDLSEATGITPVHVNRTMQELRALGLIEWKGREVHVPDMDALRRTALFNDNYLHLHQEGAHLDANE